MKILLKLREENKSTAEFNANSFLRGLHSDLGTIVRALRELVDEGYVRESNLDWTRESDRKSSVILTIRTKGPPDRKDSDRLRDPSDIKPIRLFITLAGKRFLIEDGNLAKTTWNLKNAWWLRLSFLAAGAIITVLAYTARDTLGTKSEGVPIESQESTQSIPAPKQGHRVDSLQTHDTTSESF